jgi:hypothetical protein
MAISSKQIGVTVLLGATVFIAGCTAPQPTPSATATAPSPTAAPGPGPAWDAIDQQIQADGKVSTQTALQAFSLAFGPMPGVTVPAGGAGSILDGSAAAAWLRGHWQDITTEQRAAAINLVSDLASGVPDWVNALEPTPTPSAHLDRVIVPAALRVAPTPAPTGQIRSNDFYTAYARAEVGQLAARVGVTATLKVFAHVGLTFYATSDAETLPLDSNWAGVGAPVFCSITISKQGDKTTGDDFADMMSHEAWHCIQDQFLTMARFNAPDRPNWILEGQAAWVGVTLHPGSSRAEGFWRHYLEEPAYALFSRGYDAMGFYFQMAQAGVDVWSNLVPMVKAGTNPLALALSGANNATFADLWAPGYARDSSRGAAWDMTGPGIPSTKPTPKPLSIGDGATVPASAEKVGSNQIFLISNDSTDVLITNYAAGHVRISDSAGHNYPAAGQAAFCHKTDGCECPDKTPPPQPTQDLPGPDILLAVSGGLTGVIGTISGLSLDAFCKKTTLTGTWHGTWQETGPDITSGAFTVVWTQKGNAVNGTISVTGTQCITTGPVSGTVKGNTITFGVVQGLRTITYTGTYNSMTMSGTFDAPKCGEAVGTWSAHR